MSKNYAEQVQDLETEALIDFALEHLGVESEELRQAALQEHLNRIKNDPNTVVASAGDTKLLREKLSQLTSLTLTDFS
jgi:hypothetical protein